MSLRSAASAVLSGVLLALSFPNIELSSLAWVALVPLLVALNNQEAGRAFLTGGLTGIVFFAGTISWVTRSLHVYGGMSFIGSSLIMLALCAYLALYPALFSATAVHLRRINPALFFIAAPALWTALELARTVLFTGFPWALLGYTQYRVLPAIQIADLTGVYGVSFLVVLVNTALAELLMNRKRWIPAAVAGFVVMLVLSYGFFKVRTPERAGGLTVSIIQGNIEQGRKWDEDYRSEVFGVYERLTLAALRDRPDLVIWPETSTPFYFTGITDKDRVMTEELVAFVKRIGTPLLFGSPTYEIGPNRRIIGRNSAFLLSGEGRIEATYHKLHLVPFGEYVPLKNIFFFVGKLVKTAGDFQGGSAYTIMPVPIAAEGARGEVKLCTVICYEVIFPDLVRRFVDNGAAVVTTITNDAWFGKSAAPYQHFATAVFRAVENRVPVVRAANTGVSGFIDARGRIEEASGIFTEAHITRAVAPGKGKTFYTRYGDVFAYACLILVLAVLSAGLRSVPDNKTSAGERDIFP